MEAQALEHTLREALPEVPIERLPSADLHVTISIPAEALPEAMPILCRHPGLRFTFLADVAGVDFWPCEPRFEVVYTLVSIEHRHRLRVRVRLDGADPHLTTVSPVWPGAVWLEREVWDLFGIVFDGHPDPRRLLMPDDWEGHPLRKDYPVQIRLKPQTAEPMQVTPEEFRANVARDRLVRRHP
jgi:NADH-quinone oxidoreductase subunit C